MAENSLYQTLRDRVVNGEFQAGQRLRPEVLRRDHGCAASTIRETLFRLSTVGLVEFQEQRGFRTPRQSDELRHDLTQFRSMLECEGACLSIRRGGIEWEARLSAAHHKLSHIESHVRESTLTAELMTLWTSAELEFHQTLIDACGLESLKRTHEMVYQQFRQQVIQSDKEFAFVPENIEQHRGILVAALKHDEKMVRLLIREYLSRNLCTAPSEPARSEA